MIRFCVRKRHISPSVVKQKVFKIKFVAEKEEYRIEKNEIEPKNKQIVTKIGRFGTVNLALKGF